MIFTKEFKGVKAGDIYHTDFAPGDTCPPELLDAAIACEVVEAPTEKAAKPAKPEGAPNDVFGAGIPARKPTKRK